MRLYLRLKDVPELAALPASERRSVWSQCRKKHTRNDWVFWVSLPALVFVVWWGFHFKHVLQESFAWPPSICTLLNCVFMVLVAGTWQHVMLHRLRPHMRELLRIRHA
jgi:hypothetical protein